MEKFLHYRATESYVVIIGNTSANFHAQLKNKKCEVYTNDMRIKVSITELYEYPDVVVVRGAPNLEDEHRDIVVKSNRVYRSPFRLHRKL